MKSSGVLLVMLAAIFWGISGGVANVLMNKGWDPFVISFFRGATGFLFFFIWYLIHFKQPWITSHRFYLWSVLAGLGVAGNFTFYFYSIEAANISVAVTLMYTAPVFVLLLSLLLGIERPSLFKWGSVGMVLLGIILLTKSYALETVSTSIMGTTFGLASGLSYALFIFGFKNAASIGKTKATLTVSFFSFSVVLFFLMDLDEALEVLSSGDIGWFILLGVLGSGLSFIIYVMGLRTTPPTTASIVAMIEPVTATLIGVLLLNNVLTVNQVLGIVLILTTIVLLNFKKSGQTMHEG